MINDMAHRPWPLPDSEPLLHFSSLQEVLAWTGEIKEKVSIFYICNKVGLIKETNNEA